MKKAEKNRTGKPDIEQLLKQMEEIAASLITTRYITDFTEIDTNIIRSTNAGTPFVWLVYYSGTHIYALNDAKEIQHFLNTLDYYENYSKNEFCLYLYDETKLFPVFPSVIKNRIKSANIPC